MLTMFHETYRIAHVAVGVVGLVLFWIPIFTHKGSRMHRMAGRAFVWAVYFVAGTGLLSSVWALISPTTFFNSTAPTSEEVLQQVQFLFTIFGYLAILALHGAILGMRSLKVKDGDEPLLNLPWKTVMIAQLIWGIGLIAFGVYQLWRSGYYSRYYITIALGLLGLWDLVEQRSYLRNARQPGAWLYKHLECMLGCGVAFYTAALVTMTVVFELNLPGGWALVPWLIPTAIGIPATHIVTNYYRRRWDTGQFKPSALGTQCVERAAT